MANLKISQLPTVLSAQTSDILAIVQSGVTSQLTIQNILDLVPTDTNTFVSGATYTMTAGTLTISRNDAVDLNVTGFTTMPTLNLVPSTPPTGTTHTIGVLGDIIMGIDDNLYAKTGSGWLRFSGMTF